jgi:hypothetical protein
MNKNFAKYRKFGEGVIGRCEEALIGLDKAGDQLASLSR